FAPVQALVSREEECSVFPDRTSEGEAGLVALEGRILRQPGRECVARVEPLVAEIVVDGSMKLIRAAFRDDVDDASGSAAELRAVSVAVDLEFVHRLLADGRAYAVADDVIIVDPIDLDGVGAPVLTGE